MMVVVVVRCGFRQPPQAAKLTSGSHGSSPRKVQVTEHPNIRAMDNHPDLNEPSPEPKHVHKMTQKLHGVLIKPIVLWGVLIGLGTALVGYTAHACWKQRRRAHAKVSHNVTETFDPEEQEKFLATD